MGGGAGARRAACGRSVVLNDVGSPVPDLLASSSHSSPHPSFPSSSKLACRPREAHRTPLTPLHLRSFPPPLPARPMSELSKKAQGKVWQPLAFGSTRPRGMMPGHIGFSGDAKVLRNVERNDRYDAEVRAQHPRGPDARRVLSSFMSISTHPAVRFPRRTADQGAVRDPRAARPHPRAKSRTRGEKGPAREPQAPRGVPPRRLPRKGAMRVGREVVDRAHRGREGPASAAS